MIKKIIYIDSIYALDNELSPFRAVDRDGYNLYPDFELIHLEMSKYLLIIKKD